MVIATAIRLGGRQTVVMSTCFLTVLLAGLAAALVALLRPARWGLLVGAAMVVVTAMCIGGAALNTSHVGAADGTAAADGGVLATRGAANALLDGHNPYTVSLAPSLGHAYQRVTANGPHGQRLVFANPLRHYYPYLPGAFLLQVPGQALAGQHGWFDPRWVYLAAFLLAAAAIFRWPGSDWARGAALLGVATPLAMIWGGNGSNDIAVASLVVVAALVGWRRPGWGGLALAAAVSFKFVIVIAVVPLAIVWIRRRGWRSIRDWWTFPAALAATMVPFLIWSPKAFLVDTLGFQLGTVPDKFPTSGIGLPVLWPDVFHGTVAHLALVLCTALGLGAAAWLAWRWPRPEIVAPATAVALFGLLVSADTFQTNYWVMLFTLAGAGWLLAGPRCRRQPHPGDRLWAPIPLNA